MPLSPEAAAILARLPRTEKNPYVVPGRKTGAPLSGIFLQWRLVRGQAGLDDVRLHDLRHSYASRALALGESLPTIARLLGHARVQTASRYAHLARGRVREAAARVAADIAADLLAGREQRDTEPAPDRDALKRSAARIAAEIGADILP